MPSLSHQINQRPGLGPDHHTARVPPCGFSGPCSAHSRCANCGQERSVEIAGSLPHAGIKRDHFNNLTALRDERGW
jgi:hypothetical protein